MWEEQLQAAIEAGVKAIKGILEIYNTDFSVEIKDDNSPVTMADKNADKVIREYLHEKFPTYAFLTEESTDDISPSLISLVSFKITISFGLLIQSMAQKILSLKMVASPQILRLPISMRQSWVLLSFL